jgi:hypothetical protein
VRFRLKHMMLKTWVVVNTVCKLTLNMFAFPAILVADFLRFPPNKMMHEHDAMTRTVREQKQQRLIDT